MFLLSWVITVKLMIRSLICSPHPAKYTHIHTESKKELDKFGWQELNLQAVKMVRYEKRQLGSEASLLVLIHDFYLTQKNRTVWLKENKTKQAIFLMTLKRGGKTTGHIPTYLGSDRNLKLLPVYLTHSTEFSKHSENIN